MKKATYVVTLMLLIVGSVSSQTTSQEYINIGNTKFSFLDYEGALSDYTRAINIDPYNTMAYYSRGSAKAVLEDYLGGNTRLHRSA
jgi:tetratricopeptide (TPR) repeat protein